MASSVGLVSRFVFALSSCNFKFGLCSDLVIMISSSESCLSNSVFESNLVGSLIKTSLSTVLNLGCSSNFCSLLFPSLKICYKMI